MGRMVLSIDFSAVEQKLAKASWLHRCPLLSGDDRIDIYPDHGSMDAGTGSKLEISPHQLGMFLSSGILTLISLFYWIWGYNYARAPLTQTYFDNQIVTVDSSKFMERWNLQTQRVNYIRENLVIPDSTDKSLTPT